MRFLSSVRSERFLENVHLQLRKGIKMAGKKSGARKVGRGAGTGKFIPVDKARRRKKTAVVETIKNPKKKARVRE